MDVSPPAGEGQDPLSESSSSAKQTGYRWVKWDRGVGSGELPAEVRPLGLVAGTYRTVDIKQLETLYKALWPTQQDGIPKFSVFKVSKREAPYVWQGHNVHVHNEDPAVKADKGRKRSKQLDSPVMSEQPPAKSTKVPCPLSNLSAFNPSPVALPRRPPAGGAVPRARLRNRTKPAGIRGARQAAGSGTAAASAAPRRRNRGGRPLDRRAAPGDAGRLARWAGRLLEPRPAVPRVQPRPPEDREYDRLDAEGVR